MVKNLDKLSLSAAPRKWGGTERKEKNKKKKEAKKKEIKKRLKKNTTLRIVLGFSEIFTNRTIMNNEQDQNLIRARGYIKNLRCCLDNIMYNPDCMLEDKEFKKVRKAYNLICKANDELWKL